MLEIEINFDLYYPSVEKVLAAKKITMSEYMKKKMATIEEDNPGYIHVCWEAIPNIISDYGKVKVRLQKVD